MPSSASSWVSLLVFVHRLRLLQCVVLGLRVVYLVSAFFFFLVFVWGASLGARLGRWDVAGLNTVDSKRFSPSGSLSFSPSDRSGPVV